MGAQGVCVTHGKGAPAPVDMATRTVQTRAVPLAGALRQKELGLWEPCWAEQTHQPRLHKRNKLPPGFLPKQPQCSRVRKEVEDSEAKMGTGFPGGHMAGKRPQERRQRWESGATASVRQVAGDDVHQKVTSMRGAFKDQGLWPKGRGGMF